MKIFIVGAHGFLGSNLSRWFGQTELVDAAPRYDQRNEGRWRESVLERLLLSAPDVVLMPGASQDSGDDPHSIRNLLGANCTLPCLVASLMLENLPNSKLVVFGTAWQYADSNSYRPFNLYAASKQAGRDLLEHFALRGLRILEALIFDTYGDNDKRTKLLNILQRACETGTEVDTTPGEQEIDLIHIDDVCRGVDAGLRDLDGWNPSAGVLQVGLGSGRPITVKELIKRVELLMDRPLHARVGGRPYRPREVMRAHLDYRRPTGWYPKNTHFQNELVTQRNCDRSL